MLSGKPPRPWKRSRRRGVSVGRIALLVVLLGTLATIAAWRLRPQTAAWHPTGAARIETPSLDIADERTREAMNQLQRGVLPVRQPWLGRTCSTHPVANEVYVLTDDGVNYHDGPWIARRIVVTLGTGGEVLSERWSNGIDAPPEHTRRVLDEASAEEFRRLLIDGGFARIPPAGSTGFCHRSAVALESCVHGRYYGVVRLCQHRDESPSLDALASAISAFAVERPHRHP